MKHSHERYRVQEVEGIAEAYAHTIREDTRFSVEMSDGHPYVMSRCTLPHEKPQPLFAVIHLLSYALKVGLLIFDKLDDIHTLLWEQQLRERNKEGR